MIGWPLSRSCAVACLFGDESQQPIFPHVMHIRRCTQPLPIFKHSSQPSIFSGSAVTSIWSRWLQTGPSVANAASSRVRVTLASGERLGEEQSNREIARAVGPPRLDAEPGSGGLELEALAAELRADLDPKRLIPLERQLDPETPDRNRVRFLRAEADVHPLVLRIPARLVEEAPLVERRVELTIDGGECVTDERLGHAPGGGIGRRQAGDGLDGVDAAQDRVARRERVGHDAEQARILLAVDVPLP